MVRSSHSPAKTRTRQKETLCVRCTGWQRSRPWERNWQGPIRMVRTKAKTPARELPLAGKNEGHERPLVILGHQWETETAEKPSISSELSKTRIVHAPFIANTSNLARPGAWRGCAFYRWFRESGPCTVAPASSGSLLEMQILRFSVHTSFIKSEFLGQNPGNCVLTSPLYDSHSC